MYVLLCEPDEEGNEIRYMGTTTDCERHMCQHCGISPGGATWTAEHPPVGTISVSAVENEEGAAVMEAMLFQLHASKIGYDRMRGGRWNIAQKMLRPPPLASHPSGRGRRSHYGNANN